MASEVASLSQQQRMEKSWSAGSERSYAPASLALGVQRSAHAAPAVYAYKGNSRTGLAAVLD